MGFSAHVREGVVALSLAPASACGSGAFACQEDAQCLAGGAQGVCEPTGGCSFDDPSCASGRRYGDHAPAGLAGQCVAVGTAGGDTDPMATDGSASASASGNASATSAGSISTAGPTGDTTADGGATIAITATDGATGSTGLEGGSDSSDDGSTSTGADPATFFDAFDRPDGAVIGNGWIEKTPGAFRLLDQQVELDTQNGLNFRDNLFYRPLAESMLDVEASMVVNFVTDDPFGFPQMHLRVQPGDVATPGSLTSYAVFVDTNDPALPLLTVNRIDGPDFGPSESVPIEPPPIDAETYRLRGRITGTDPVVLEGFFEVLQAGAWQVRTEATLLDADPDRIVDPGTLGGGGHVELQHFVLDDFSYTELGG